MSHGDDADIDGHLPIEWQTKACVQVAKMLLMPVIPPQACIFLVFRPFSFRMAACSSTPRFAMPQTHHLPTPAALHALQSGGVEAWYQQQLAEFVQTQGYHFSYRTFQDRTDRAKAPLVTAADLVAYNACYAASHIARFRCLLDHFADCQQLSPSIRVVDYGCGQGLASLVLLEYLQDYPQSLQIELHLIEPSALALQHATAYVQHHPAAQCHHITVVAHQTTLNQLPMPSTPAEQTIHLFSNVLDIAYLRRFDLRYWAATTQQHTGEHICLGVSPAFWDGQVGFHQLLRLCPAPTVWVNQTHTLVNAEVYHIYQQRMLTKAHPTQLLAFRFAATPQQEAC